MTKSAIIYTIALILMTSTAFAKTPVDETGTVEQETPPENAQMEGQKEARKYFKASKASSPSGSEDHYLAVHLGSFLSSDSYAWGGISHQTNPGRINIGLTYRLGTAFGSMADSAVRVDFIGYDLDLGRPVQIVILPMVTFPEVGSKFPLYFGAGLGAGFFFNQINNESFLSANYQLVAGARFFDVFEGAGFFLEGGVKNNILLLSDGQFIGYFLSVGAVFTF